MNKQIGILIIVMSLMTLSIIFSLNNIAITIQEIQTGNFSYGNALNEMTLSEYLPIILSIIVGIVIVIKSKNK